MATTPLRRPETRRERERDQMGIRVEIEENNILENWRLRNF